MNCSNSGSLSLKQPSPSIWSVTESHRHKAGGRFSTTTLGAWFPLTSSLCPPWTFRVLFVFVVLARDRRRVIHFNVTESPTAKWTAQQIVEAFPWDAAPRYLLHDRDRIYGHEFANRVNHMGIKEVKIAPRSPWQNPFVERLIETVRRDCLDGHLFPEG